MCGLVGVVGNLTSNDKKAFNFMLGIDSCRGEDSAGVARAPALLKDRKNVEIVKAIGDGYDLRKVKEYFNNDKNKEIAGDWAFLMGHNRFATVGSVTDRNAHPFKCGDIYGAQNGTLPDYWRKKLYQHDLFQTDTEALFHNISLFGVEDVIPRIDGAWALTWYDAFDDTFHILRNKERPLCFAWKKNGQVLYYASEPWMIYAAAEKFGIALENDLVYWFAENTHYQWEIGSVYMFDRKRQSSSELKGWALAPHSHVSTSNNRGSSASTSSTSSVQSANQNASGGSATANIFASSSNPETGKLSDDPMQKASYWQAKIGTFKEFVMSPTIFTDEQRKTHMKGFTVDGHIEIRFYPSSTIDLEAVLGNKDVQTYAVKIKRVKLRSNGKSFYLLPDNDTIMEATYKGNEFRKGDAPVDTKIDDDIPFNEDLFTINGVPVSEKEWEDRVSCGCAWCSYVPPESEAGALTWLRGGHDFLCEACSESPDIRQYVNLFNQ